MGHHQRNNILKMHRQGKKTKIHQLIFPLGQSRFQDHPSTQDSLCPIRKIHQIKLIPISRDIPTRKCFLSSQNIQVVRAIPINHVIRIHNLGLIIPGVSKSISNYNHQELLNQPVNPSYQGNPNQPGYRDSQVFPNPPYPQGYPNQAGDPKSKGSSIQDTEKSNNFDRNSELKYPGGPLNPNRLPNQVPIKSQQPAGFDIQLDNRNLDPSKQKINPMAFDGMPAVKNNPPFPNNPSMSQSGKLNESPDSKSSLLQSLGQTGNMPESVGKFPPVRDLSGSDRDAKLQDQLPPPPNVNLPVGMPPPPAY